MSDRERRVIHVPKPRTVIDRYETEYIAPKDWGTFGEFLKARERSPRYTVEEKRAKDTRKFGKCPGCHRKHEEADKVHFAQSVFKNGKCIGNLLACSDCADLFNQAVLKKENV